MPTMDGGCRRLEVRADVTIQDIRAQLSGERPLPPFHEIRLLQGERELGGSSNANEVELQAVVIVDPCRARLSP